MWPGSEAGGEWSQLARVVFRVPMCTPQPMGVSACPGSRWPPLKLITSCSGEQYGNGVRSGGNPRTQARSHAHCSLEHDAAAAAARAPQRHHRAPLTGGRPAPGTASAPSRPASPAPPREPPKLPGCCRPPPSAPSKQAGRGCHAAAGQRQGAAGGSPRAGERPQRPAPPAGASWEMEPRRGPCSL